VPNIDPSNPPIPPNTTPNPIFDLYGNPSTTTLLGYTTPPGSFTNPNPVRLKLGCGAPARPPGELLAANPQPAHNPTTLVAVLPRGENTTGWNMNPLGLRSESVVCSARRKDRRVLGYTFRK
jgi:hypothetical protein